MDFLPIEKNSGTPINEDKRARAFFYRYGKSPFGVFLVLLQKKNWRWRFSQRKRNEDSAEEASLMINYGWISQELIKIVIV